MMHQNQLAFLPYARSGRAEADLFEQYPALAEQLEQSRQQTVDSMRLRSKLHEDEGRSASVSRVHVRSWTKGSPLPVAERSSRASPQQVSLPMDKPTLVVEESKDDDLFEMDEEREVLGVTHGSGVALSSPSLAAVGSQGLEPIGSPHSSLECPFDAAATSMGSSLSSLPVLMRNPMNPVSTKSDSHIEQPRGVADLAKVGVPWQVAPQIGLKTGLKDIVVHASTCRSSNLTFALNGDLADSTRSSHKVSQKDRKKLHKQLQMQREENSRHRAPEITEAEPNSKMSPWQTCGSTPKQDLASGSPLQGTASLSTQPLTGLQPKGSMTMRQTVSGTPSAARDNSLKQSGNVSIRAIAHQTRPAQPSIQSIRHTPSRPQSSPINVTQVPLSDILLQQQMEKRAIKEATAKQSLQEIQQEQEFQQWWDSESRRVQQEEATALNPSRRVRLKDGRRRGGLRRATGSTGFGVVPDRFTATVTGAESEGMSGSGSSCQPVAEVRGGQGRGPGRSRGKGDG